MDQSAKFKRINLILNILCCLLLSAVLVLYVYHNYYEGGIVWLPGIILLAAAAFNWWRTRNWLQKEYKSKNKKNTK